MKRALAALCVVTCIGIFSAFAAPCIARPDDPKSAGKMEKKEYYLCSKCKLFYTATAAKNVKYKDPMGHKLAKSTSIPHGYKNGAAMKGMHKSDTQM